MIYMKYQVLFLLSQKKKKFKMSSAAVLIRLEKLEPNLVYLVQYYQIKGSLQGYFIS